MTAPAIITVLGVALHYYVSPGTDITGSCWEGVVAWLVEVVVGTGVASGDKSWEAGREGKSGWQVEGRGLQPLQKETNYNSFGKL